MATEEISEPMGSGRRKLQGALDELVQQSKEVEDKQPTDLTEDSAMEEAAKSLVELPNSIKIEDPTGVKKKNFVSPKKRRRRRKKELISTSDGKSSRPPSRFSRLSISLSSPSCRK
ncbi:hypothetical protein GBAR_LOCUS3109 [Geodia barretti]|uniref:Uncharacterized protein n=1 Tax=Geodia barretti TaxID=519541 RepID=A0AA35R3P1_GEOBA|nr:hypothetical protein GBAR_LOCUS3109 [Geodia barretti]